VVSYTLAKRTGETGLRMALGATRGRLLRTIVLQCLRLTVVGIALGLGAAEVLKRSLESLLYRYGAAGSVDVRSRAPGSAMRGFLGLLFAGATRGEHRSIEGSTTALVRRPLERVRFVAELATSSLTV
jgi:predicted lysophospholipase L1 biosynthesis ABC-type transport system permease subunit